MKERGLEQKRKMMNNFWEVNPKKEAKLKSEVEEKQEEYPENPAQEKK